MDSNMITLVGSLIGSLGFPIVACIGMAMYLREVIRNHKEEVNKMTDAINNNTLAITKLVERMDKDEK